MAKNKEKKVKKNKAAKVESNKVDSKPTKEATKKAPAKKEEVVNIFTACNLEAKHRAVPFQLSRNYDLVTVVRNRSHFPYICDVMTDSVFMCALVLKGAVSFWSMTGKKFQNLEIMAEDFSPKADGLYMCELNSETGAAKLHTLISPFRSNAITAPQKLIVDEKTSLSINDYITLEEFTTGKSELTYTLRKERLAKATKKLVKKSKGKFTYPTKVTVADEQELTTQLATTVEEGSRGLLIRGEELPYVAGHQNFHYLHLTEKLANHLTCIGAKEGAGANAGKLMSLIFQYKDGTELEAKFSDAYTEEQNSKMLAAISKGKKKKDKKKDKKDVSPLGKVFEVNYYETGAKGIPSNPKVGSPSKKKAEY